MIYINPGVISNLILVLLFVLVLTGWFGSVVNLIGSKKGVLVFLATAFIFSFINLPVTAGWEINLGGLLFPSAAYIIQLIKTKQNKIHILTATALFGTSYFVFKELIYLDPVLLIWDEVYQTPTLVVLIIMLIVPQLNYRIIMLLGGILLGELIFNIRHNEMFPYIVLGGNKTGDILWLSILQIIILHYVVIGFKNIINFKKYIDLLRIR